MEWSGGREGGRVVVMVGDAGGQGGGGGGGVIQSNFCYHRYLLFKWKMFSLPLNNTRRKLSIETKHKKKGETWSSSFVELWLGWNILQEWISADRNGLFCV